VRIEILPIKKAALLVHAVLPDNFAHDGIYDAETSGGNQNGVKHIGVADEAEILCPS